MGESRVLCVKCSFVTNENTVNELSALTISSILINSDFVIELLDTTRILTPRLKNTNVVAMGAHTHKAP